MKLYTTKQIRELENLAIRGGISEGELMHRAAASALQLIIDNTPPVFNEIVIFCGTGNNGGDGYTLAKLAAVEEGYRVRIRYFGDLSKLKGEAKFAMHECQKLGIEIQPFSKHEDLYEPIYVDALLGIGLNGTVTKEYQDCIEYINDRFGPFCLSLDVPSGICADTGKVMGKVVHADATITFIGNKQGIVTGDATGFCGDLAVSELGIPESLFDVIADHAAETIDPTKLVLKIPFRKAHMHKGYFGHVLVIGGNIGMSGAAQMTGLGALRAGAGLVSIATHPDHAKLINIAHPELMCHGVKDEKELKPLIEKATVIAIGPGLGQDEWANNLLDVALKCDKPLVVDADALNILSKTYD